jgi:hypothetical protein
MGGRISLEKRGSDGASVCVREKRDMYNTEIDERGRERTEERDREREREKTAPESLLHTLYTLYFKSYTFCSNMLYVLYTLQRHTRVKLYRPVQCTPTMRVATTLLKACVLPDLHTLYTLYFKSYTFCSNMLYVLSTLKRHTRVKLYYRSVHCTHTMRVAILLTRRLAFYTTHCTRCTSKATHSVLTCCTSYTLKRVTRVN